MAFAGSSEARSGLNAMPRCDQVLCEGGALEVTLRKEFGVAVWPALMNGEASPLASRCARGTAKALSMA